MVMEIYDYFMKFEILAVLQAVFLIAMIIYLFNTDMDSSAKLTWCGLFMFFPVPTALMLLFTRLDVGHRTEKKKHNQMLRASRRMIKQNSETIVKEELINSGTADLCFYLNTAIVCSENIFCQRDHLRAFFPFPCINQVQLRPWKIKLF